MKASDYIGDYLHAQGVTHVFELVGGMITHLLDSICRQGKIRLVSVHHEQAASFAADAFGRVSGVPGVAMATSGPGATNLVTAIADAKLDSIPMLAITGQLPTSVIGSDAFQETPIVEVCRGISKHHYLVTVVNDLARV